MAEIFLTPGEWMFRATTPINWVCKSGMLSQQE